MEVDDNNYILKSVKLLLSKFASESRVRNDRTIVNEMKRIFKVKNCINRQSFNDSRHYSDFEEIQCCKCMSEVLTKHYCCSEDICSSDG